MSRRWQPSCRASRGPRSRAMRTCSRGRQSQRRLHLQPRPDSSGARRDLLLNSTPDRKNALRSWKRSWRNFGKKSPPFGGRSTISSGTDLVELLQQPRAAMRGSTPSALRINNSRLHSAGELSPSIASRTILMGGKPWRRSSLWNSSSEKAAPCFFFMSSRSFMISSFPSV